MDLPKIKTLIDFVGRSNVTELTVTERDVTVRIFRTPNPTDSFAPAQVAASAATGHAQNGGDVSEKSQGTAVIVTAPIFGVLHRAAAPGQEPFVEIGDIVEEGQTLFIIEAMKVFNKIAAPRAGRIRQITQIDGGEVETGAMLAEIA